MFKVATGDNEGRATHWFASFLAETIMESNSLQEALDNHNARASSSEFNNIGDPLLFESEHDYLMFVLKWT